MTDRLEFLVQGGSLQPYTVAFWRDGDNLTSSCTCMAGIRGTYCKHRIALLEGDYSAVVSDNKDDFSKLQEMVKGSDVEEPLQLVRESIEAKKMLKMRVNLSPGCRRHRIPDERALEILEDGGILHEHIRGGYSYWDVYDEVGSYFGSIKRGTSLGIELSRYHNYLFPAGSRYDLARVAANELTTRKERLKQALLD